MPSHYRESCHSAPLLRQRSAIAAAVLVAAAAGLAGAGPVEASGRCTRLPLSDIQFGEAETIAVARQKLDEYAAEVAKRRGWSALRKSNETVACEHYLYIPLLGQEYRCVVTATFCDG